MQADTGVAAGMYVGLSTLNTYIPSWTSPISYVWWATGNCGSQSSTLVTSNWANYYESLFAGYHSQNEGGQCLAAGQGMSMTQYWVSNGTSNPPAPPDYDYDLTAQCCQYETSGATSYYGGYMVPGYGDGTP